MNVKSMLLRGAVCAGMFAVVALIVGGCEKAEGLKGLTLDPDSATLGPEDQTLLITVTGGVTNQPLALPLTWRVSDPDLGTIEHSGGHVARYRRSGRIGVNTVIARDQYKNEGFCVIQQVADVYALVLTASPASPIQMGGATTISLTLVEGAKPPFTWQKLSGPGSVAAGAGSTSAVYSSSAPGVGVIRVTDGNGVQAVISIVVQEPEAVDPDDDGADDDDGGPGGI